jgi:CheY-like chemotaxis protein
LNASPDATLLKDRARLLNEAGYYTTAAHSPEEAMQMAATMNCDLALICYSFDSTQRATMSERLRRLSPGTIIVWLQPGMDDNNGIFVSGVKNALQRIIA